MIFESSLSNKAIPHISTYSLLFENNLGYERSRVCYTNAEEQNETLTFGEIHDITLKFGAGLKRLIPDFQQGDVVAFITKTELTYLAAVHGPVAIGGVSASIDATFDVNKMIHCLQLINPRVLIVSPDTIEKALEATSLMNMPKEKIFVFGDQDINDCRSFNKAFLDHDQFATPIVYTPEELSRVPCFYCFTSGTTGKPKAVIITHRMIVATTLGMELNDLTSSTHFLSMSAPHHVSIIYVLMHMHLYFGFHTYVLKQEETTEKIFKTIQDCNIHILFVPPRIIATMAKESTLYNISSLKVITCGGSVMNKDVALMIYQRFKIPVVNFYGMTEVMGPFKNGFDYTIAGQIGVLKPGFSCKLIDKEGKMVGFDTPGELCIKGPSLTQGYYNNQEIFNQLIHKDGFFQTGDLFQCSQDGIFSFINRATDIIKYKSNFINPQDIENVLMKHPLVIDCAVVSSFSEEETVYVPRAFALLLNNDNHTEVKKEMLEMVKIQLPDVMQLRGGLYIAKTLPRTSTGKVERRVLRLTTIENWILN
ncbi:uncharacterized protein BX663DRAFT_463313 [Cokeromyces recurvatus]|uniref:uncharacterized protein n=1 Tax=Cokeromyces recurvatus TaxID=90255 RepID=UPI00221F8745|nr:uncharacterized protein BX663DRAFT_463313 [Cokeromyces recurvatus]KAI7897638.1 hypothetical protein BX663DRAFT_463313 [Cokeromyces recurvatus]